MSATLAMLLKVLDPSLKIEIYDVLGWTEDRLSDSGDFHLRSIGRGVVAKIT